MKRSRLSRDEEKARAFQRRGQRSSARWADANRSELERKAGLSRGTRIRPRNPERRERMSGKVFGALCNRVRRERCCVWDATGCEGDVSAHHVRSRGAGYGDRLEDGTGNVAPLCHKHHREVHQYGRITFEEIHGVDLADVARKIGETA